MDRLNSVLLVLDVVLIAFCILFVHTFILTPYYEDLLAEPIEQSNLAAFSEVMTVYLRDKEYNETSFNCINYTKDAADIADALGVQYQIVSGCPINGSCHRWIKIVMDYEPQGNKLIDYSNIYFNQTVLE